MPALRLLLLMPVVGLLAGCEGRDERFPLVKDGRAAPIVLPSGAEASTELAAKELADYVEKITGRRPAVLTNDCARVPRVEIGTLNTMRGLPDALVRRFDASPSWESHVVICTKDVLRIIGRDEVAELYGTYRFLEEKLDVRWFKEWTSEDPGDYHPTRAELEIPACETFKAPDLDERSLSQTGASSGYVPHRGIEWTVRLGVEAAYAHDFLGDEMDADARFVAGGPKFSTTGKALPQDVFSLGPTIDVQISDRDSLWLGYELEIDTDSGVSQGVNAGYRHRF